MISLALSVAACVAGLIALEGWWRANAKIRENRATYRAASARERARYLELESRLSPLLDLPPLLNDGGNHGSAILVAWRASTEPGLRVLCAAPTVVDVDLQFDQVFRLVPRYLRGSASTRSGVIRLRNGSRICFRVADEDNLRELDADMVWWGSRKPTPVEVAMAIAGNAPTPRHLLSSQLIGGDQEETGANVPVAPPTSEGVST